jgi:cysteine desulfurase
MDRIYLDYAATSPMDLETVNRMLPFFTEQFGNPSSLHYLGQQADHAVETARKTILQLFKSSDYDLVFTSGGTESDNLAIKGVMNPINQKQKKRILISAIEHPAIEKTAKRLASDGIADIDELRVDNYGLIINEELQEKISGTSLVSVVWANNEIGTVNDIKVIAQICHRDGVLFHTDAVQAAAHININLKELDIDMLSIGAHKFSGPKGVGCLVYKKSIKLDSQNVGGGQEAGLRGGTHNVPLIVGMQAALEKVYRERESINLQMTHLRDQIIDDTLQKIQGSYLTGHPTSRLPNHASFVFEGVKGQDLVLALDMAGFSVSSGSACKVGNPSPSQVLLAIGIPPDLAMGALRVTVGRNTKENEVRYFLEVLPQIIRNLRNG